MTILAHGGQASAELAGGRRAGKLLGRPFLLVLVATFAYFVSVGVLVPALPLYVEGPLGRDGLSVGLVVGAFSLSALLLRPWAGRAGDRRGRRVLMVSGAALAAASTAAYLVADAVPALVGLRLVTGAGEALFFVGAVSAISDLAPPARRGEAMSLFSLAPYAGMAVGPALGEALLGDLAGEASDFRAAWLVAVLCAGLAALAALRVPETRASANGSVGGRLVHRAAILPGLVLLTSWWSFTAFLAFMPLHAREVGLPDSRLVFVVFAAIMLTIRSAGARIPDVPSDRGARRAPRSLSSPSA